MSDSNLPGIVADVLQLAEQEGERAIAETITAELLQVCVCLLPECCSCVAASCSPCCVDLLVACHGWLLSSTNGLYACLLCMLHGCTYG